MINLYIDVDGVILGKNDPSSPLIVLARHAPEFLEFVVSNFSCFWLTTHCDGTSASVLNYLRRYTDADTLLLMAKIKPAKFKIFKTEVITGNFIWLDDAPMASERAWLQSNGWLDRWIEVNTRKKPEDLLRVMGLLKTANDASAESPAP